MNAPSEHDAPLLGAAARELLDRIVGGPSEKRVSAAIEEVERQVAMEDLLILMVNAASEASLAFFELVSHVAEPVLGEPRPPEDRRPRS